MIINYVLCGLWVWLLMGLLHEISNGAHPRWVTKLCDGVIGLPWCIIFYLLICIIYPIACIWLFFRNAIKGVSEQAWETAKITRFWKVGCFRFCYDPDARKLINKLFLVRIVTPAEKVNHDSAKK